MKGICIRKWKRLCGSGIARVGGDDLTAAFEVDPFGCVWTWIAVTVDNGNRDEDHFPASFRLHFQMVGRTRRADFR